jgi:hypothetical protein
MRLHPAIIIGAALASPSPALAQQTPSTRVVVAPALFEFHSAFWVNLHNYLYAAARVRRGYDAGRPAFAQVAADTARAQALNASQRRAWGDALDYYVGQLADRDVVFDQGMIDVQNRLVEAGSAQSLPPDGLDRELVGVLEAAAASYRDLWWSRHDEANRAWAGALLPLLEQHGDTMASRMTSAFRMPWPASPIRVDVTAYANWSGAYTTERPSHITVSSLDEMIRGGLDLETMFHEAMHTMEDSVVGALRRAGQRHGRPDAADAVHAMIFYTAGDAAKRVLGTTYVPYAERVGLWTRARNMAQYRDNLRANWQPFLDGRTSFEEAIDTIVRTMRQ